MTDARIVYQSDAVTLWHGDALEVLPTIEKESTGLILTDPPYGVEWRSNTRAERFDMLLGDGRDDRDGIRDVMTECVRIVAQNRHLYVFGPADVIADQKVSEVVELIWDKGTIGSGDMTSAWGPQHERISFCVSKFRHAGQSGATSVPTRLRKGSVLRFTRPTGRNVRHPSEKPVPLLSELIESSTRRGDVVVDPFAGVGSTGVAAILAGRRALLVELDERWIPVAIERLRAAEAAAALAATA
jgi:DNA modification methylase